MSQNNGQAVGQQRSFFDRDIIGIFPDNGVADLLGHGNKIFPVLIRPVNGPVGSRSHVVDGHCHKKGDSHVC